MRPLPFRGQTGSPCFRRFESRRSCLYIYAVYLLLSSSISLGIPIGTYEFYYYLLMEGIAVEHRSRTNDIHTSIVPNCFLCICLIKIES